MTKLESVLPNIFRSHFRKICRTKCLSVNFFFWCKNVMLWHVNFKRWQEMHIRNFNFIGSYYFFFFFVPFFTLHSLIVLSTVQKRLPNFSFFTLSHIFVFCNEKHTDNNLLFSLYNLMVFGHKTIVHLLSRLPFIETFSYASNFHTIHKKTTE